MPSRRFVCRLVRPLLALFRLLIRRRRLSGKRQNIFRATRIHQMFFRERARDGNRAQAQAYISVPPFSLLPQTDRRPRCEAKKSVGVRRGEYAKQNAPRPRDEEYMQPASSGLT